MTKENYKISKIQIGFYYLLMFLILIWFLVIQFTGINNHNAKIQSSDITYRGTFTWIHSDGSKEQIAVPGHYNVPAKETMVITTTLPENYTQSSLAIRSSLQDIRFYIDGVLRTEYSTKDHRLTGKNSASCYVFCPTSAGRGVLNPNHQKSRGHRLKMAALRYCQSYLYSLLVYRPQCCNK